MDAVEEIKSRLSIEDVVGRTVDLKRSGSGLKGLCPFHQEKTPSFYVSPSRGTYHCFGCNKGGDIFTFVMETERVPFPDAMKELAEQAGVSLPERETRKPSAKNRLFEANEAAARYFATALRSAQGERARAYLDRRQFGGDAIDQFGLGYSPNGRAGLVQTLNQAGFDDRTLLAAGLAMQDDVGGAARDRFHGRLMFPIRDLSGRITGFGGRALQDDVQPKYLNSPQTEIFDKSSVLYGISLSGDSIRLEGRAVLVEGYLDAIRAHINGFSNTVASLGTSVTTQQLTLLSRLTTSVVLALDPDPAGQAAAARTSLAALAEVTQSRGRAPGAAGALDLLIARLPEGRGDPDELIRDEPRLWEESLAAAVPAFEFYFEQTMGSLDRSTEAWRQEAIDRLLPPIQQLSTSAGWQAVWLQRLAAETGVDPSALQRSLPAGSSTRPRRRPAGEGRGQEVVASTTARALSADPVDTVERSLMSLLLKIVVIPSEAFEALKGVELTRAQHRRLLQALMSWRSSDNYDYEMFREELDDETAAYADELRVHDDPLPEDGKISVAVEFHLTRLRQAQLDSQYRRAASLLEDMTAEDRAAATSTVAALMAERLTLERELDRLSLRSVQARHG
ncbi:MAG TPA: DNA primase [Chloroflexota bacterium]